MISIYAPFFASSRPIVVCYHDQWFFPLFRYLFFQGFYTKPLDIFFNLFIFTLPIFCFCFFKNKKLLLPIFLIHCFTFLTLLFFPLKNPASNPSLVRNKKEFIAKNKDKKHFFLSWQQDKSYLSDYQQLNLIVRYKVQKKLDQTVMQKYGDQYFQQQNRRFPTLFYMHQKNVEKKISRLKELEKTPFIQKKIQYEEDKEAWLKKEAQNIHFILMPIFRPFHWEDDAGGEQSINQYVNFYELTRINRKDLMSALIFGVRISFFVGLVSVLLALIIGIPIGAIAGYYGGKIDIITSRFIEIWESMPSFFMLLLIISITQSKSIFLVIVAIGIFGWTGFSRFIRGEFLKQRSLSYVEACKSQGFSDYKIIFSEILPNALPPVLTLLPFSIMGAMTSEAGLSFLGLGEEGSCSWGVLMDEGRSAFPAESYLLWPAAFLLTILLVSIALVGDALRDTMDPRSS